MRIAAAAVFFAYTLAAQISAPLGTNFDGSVVFLQSGSWLQDRPRPANFQQGYFRLADGAWQPAYEDSTRPGLNPVRLNNLQVNSRGDEWLITTNTPCLGGSSCMVIPDTNFSYAITAGGRQYMNGEVNISPDFRYYTAFRLGSLFGNIGAVSELADRQDPSRKVNLPRRPIATGQAVSNTGRTMFVTEEGLTVVSFEERFVIPESVGTSGAWISADGETIAFVVGSRWKVWRSGAVVTDRPRHGQLMKLTADGEWALFLNVTADGTTQARLYRTTVDEAATQLGPIRGGLVSAVISGDGRVLIGWTNHGRLIRLDIATGEETTLLTGPPGFFTTALRPGSTHQLIGAGWTEETHPFTPPYPESFGGIEVRVDGRAMPLQRIAPNRIDFQVPWDFRATGASVAVEVRTAEANPFVSTLPPRNFAEIGPLFLVHPPSGAPPLFFELGRVLVFGEDLTTPLPSMPPGGDVVSVLMTGLGPVSPPIDTGVITPAGLQSRTLMPVSCQVNSQPVEVLFAGLAPGHTGVYQVSFRMPAVTAPRVPIACIVGGFRAGASLGSLPGR